MRPDEKSSGGRDRTGDSRLMKPIASRRNPNDVNGCGDASSSLAQPLAQDSPKPLGIDPDLARVADAWPNLSPPIRAAVLALVQSAAAGPGNAPVASGRVGKPAEGQKV